MEGISTSLENTGKLLLPSRRLESSAKHRSSSGLDWSLAALFIATTALHFYHYLATPSFWFDESALMTNIINRGFVDLLGPLDGQQAAPPLFLWMLRALYDTFGCTELSMRFPAFVGGILTTCLCWVWARQYISRTASLVLVMLAGFSMHGLELANEVKPYTLDAMWTILILYAGGRLLRNDPSRLRMAAMISLAMLGPWASFPAVFALFGVGIAWIVEAKRLRNPLLISGLLVYGLIGVCSCLAFWNLVGRHQHSNELAAWWNNYFWDFSSPSRAVLWPFGRLRGIVDYATTSMGIPFLLAAPFGIWALARHSPQFLWMAAGLIGSAFVASGLRKYPLEGRVAFFMAPLLWLIMAAAFDFAYQRVPRKRAGCLFSCCLPC